MTNNSKEYLPYFQKWDHLGLKDEQIREELAGAGFAEAELAEISRLYKKRKADARTQRGLQLIALGGAIGFLSCLPAVLGILPDISGFVFYGLTTIGISLALLGGYYVFE